jgi:predicted phosphoribosyltransferase
MRFTDLVHAGQQLADVVNRELDKPLPRMYCPIAPHGVTVAEGMGAAPSSPLIVERSDAGVLVSPPPREVIEGACVIVVDDGVETGTVAREAAHVLAALQPGWLVLAVPVCPHEAIADLHHRYDQIIAVHKPLVRRALRWHYDHLA